MADDSHNKVVSELKLKFKDSPYEVTIPPPVFVKMNGRVITYDSTLRIMKIVFPIMADYLNPFGSMQGGMIAAAIDNTIGPLSMLVAPLNYSRLLEVKYRKQIREDTEFITVIGQYEERKKSQLYFSAKVVDTKANELASAKAIHWIVDENN
jgi:acyl-coenzyme A thioesterase PaaI-like protein